MDPNKELILSAPVLVQYSLRLSKRRGLVGFGGTASLLGGVSLLSSHFNNGLLGLIFPVW